MQRINSINERVCVFKKLKEEEDDEEKYIYINLT